MRASSMMILAMALALLFAPYVYTFPVCLNGDMENAPAPEEGIPEPGANIPAPEQQPFFDPLLNHALAQQIYKVEEIRVAQGDLTALAASQQDENDLQGEPLTYKQCRQLCPNHFVRHELFRVSGNAKPTAPLKVSDLQHTTLARHMLSRFIQVYRSQPNNNQVAIYFIQQCYCYYVLRFKVDWNDCPTTGGVGKGRPAEKVHAQEMNQELPPRKRCFTYLPEETAVTEQLATQGVESASQGDTPATLRAENALLKRKVAWYEQRFGPIPEEELETSEATTSLGSSQFRVSDLFGENQNL